MKEFRFSEHRYFQFRFESFNTANHPDFGDPGASLTGEAIPGSYSFGLINTLRAGIDMRELQVSLKFVF